MFFINKMTNISYQERKWRYSNHVRKINQANTVCGH